VFVEGSIRNRSYDDKNGNKRYITEIVAQNVRFLGGGGGTRVAREYGDEAPGEQPAENTPVDDDVPF
jgi:single-strand DNA-binding protein